MNTNKNGDASFGVAIYDPVRNQERIGFGEVYQYKGDLTQPEALKEYRSAKERLPNMRVIFVQQIQG